MDPFWPKPLPNKWIMQQVPTLIVDNDDHIWVFNRSRGIRPDENGASTTPPRTDCCIAGPAVLEFDADGNLLNAWGGPGYVPIGRASKQSTWTGWGTSGSPERNGATAS